MDTQPSATNRQLQGVRIMNIIRPFVIILAILFSGCAHGPSIYQQELDQRRSDAISKMVFMNCADMPEGATQCGLILSDPPKAYQDFAKQNCHGMKMKKCFPRFSDSFFAKMGLRYPQADWRQINLECTANPQDCSSLQAVEIKALQSHNAALSQKIENDKIDLQNQADEDSRERTRAALNAFSEGMRRSQPVQCTTWGNTTTCR